MNITPTPKVETKKRQRQDSEIDTDQKKSRRKRLKTDFKYNMVVPSLNTYDISNLLAPYHLYNNQQDELKGIIKTHSDFIERFNDSIVYVSGEMYLLKYRYASAISLPRPIFFYIHGLLHDLGAFDAALETFEINSQDILTPKLLQDMIQNVQFTNPWASKSNRNIKFALNLAFLIWQEPFVEMMKNLNEAQRLEFEARFPENKWNGTQNGLVNVLYNWMHQADNNFPLEAFLAEIMELISNWRAIAEKSNSFAWILALHGAFAAIYPSDRTKINRFTDFISAEMTRNQVVNDISAILPLPDGFLPKMPLFIKMLQQWVRIYNQDETLPLDEKTFYKFLQSSRQDTLHSPLHPHYYNWQTDLRYSDAGAGFAILQLTKTRSLEIKIIRNFLYANYSPIQLATQNNLDPYHVLGDARILKDTEFTIKTSTVRYAMSVSTDCSRDLMCIGKLFLDVTNRDWKEAQLHFDPEQMPTTTVPCQEGAKILTYGRNWSMFKRDGSILFSYQFLPHVVYQPLTKNLAYCKTFEIKQPEKIDLLFRFGSLYKFSLGTPAIPYSAREYIAVGHSRFNIPRSKKDAWYFQYSEYEGQHYLDFDAEKKRVYPDSIDNRAFYYFMYFYAFDRETLAITRMSYSFIVAPNEPYWVQFPVGICALGTDDTDKAQTFLVSYGEGDVRSKLFMIDRHDIEKLLMPIDAVVTDPDGYQFLRFVS